MKLAAAVAVAVGLAVVTPASAGPLNGHPNALPGWTGTAPFANGSLTGTIDYAVFGPGDFPYAGYTPSPGEVTYVYQINNTGVEAVSAQFTGLAPGNGANNIGNFIINPLANPPEAIPSFQQITATTAQWLFNPGIPSSIGTSAGLVFSSPNAPMNGIALVVDGGTNAQALVPTPSDQPIPEPAVLMLMAAGGVMIGFRRRG